MQPITCKHFQPSAASMQHHGTEMNPAYEYANPVQSHVCCEPELNSRNNLPTLGCMYRNDHAQCEYYQPNPVKVVHKGISAHHQALVTKQLHNEGFVTYSLFFDGDLVEKVDVHADPDGVALIEQHFSDLVEEHQLARDQVIAPDETKQSYLSKVLG